MARAGCAPRRRERERERKRESERESKRERKREKEREREREREREHMCKRSLNDDEMTSIRKGQYCVCARVHVYVPPRSKFPGVLTNQITRTLTHQLLKQQQQ